MRDIPFELKLLGAGSDPAPAPFTGFRQDGMPSDAEIQAALRRARAERANTFVSLIAGVVAWIRKGHQIADPVDQAIHDSRCREAALLRRAAQNAGRALAGRANARA